MVYVLTAGRQITAKCMVCDTAFSFVTKTRGRHPRFCSEQCRNQRRRVSARASYRRHPRQANKRLTCVNCGNGFLGHDLRRKCCGRACGRVVGKKRSDAARARNAKLRRTRTCETCGRAFVMRNPSGRARAGLSREGRFCSRACVGDASRGKTPRGGMKV